MGQGIGVPAVSGNGGTMQSRYAIYSHGMRVGELTAIRALVPWDNAQALQFKARTRVDADFLVYCYNLDNEEEAFIGERGTVRYSRKTRENGKELRVDGRLDGDRFLLRISGNGSVRSMVVERSRYDHTTMECPEIAMKREGEELTLRLLDLETLMVVNRRYRWEKSEDVTVDGRKIRCRVVTFEDCNKKCRRWIAPDGSGALIVRQDGTGKDGSYSLRLTKLMNGS